METKFRKKPVIIEAVQFNNSADIHEFCKDKVREPIGKDYLEIETLEGTMKAIKYDWIIKGVNGEFYPCKPDIFEKTYEPVNRSEPVKEKTAEEFLSENGFIVSVHRKDGDEIKKVLIDPIIKAMNDFASQQVNSTLQDCIDKVKMLSEIEFAGDEGYACTKRTIEILKSKMK